MNLRLLAIDALDPRLVAAQLLEREADATAGMLDDLTNREARLRHEARRLRAAVADEHEVEHIVAVADAQLDRRVPMRRRKA